MFFGVAQRLFGPRRARKNGTLCHSLLLYTVNKKLGDAYIIVVVSSGGAEAPAGYYTGGILLAIVDVGTGMAAKRAGLKSAMGYLLHLVYLHYIR